jgi:DNA-binding PadR family transcriptional regulator
MMRAPTTNEFLLMTLLGEGPATGYDLDAKVAERRLRSWTPLGKSSLYFLLEGMRRRGWIASRSAPGARGPARCVCRLTAKGTEALRARVIAAMAEPGGADVDIACMNASRIPEFGALLAGYERSVSERLAGTREAARHVSGPHSLAPKLIYGRHIASLGAELAWARAALKQMRRTR